MHTYPTPSELLKQHPRFWSKVAFPTDLTQCWLWQRTKVTGYGYFGLRPKQMILAHRFAYETIIGSIPISLVVDHLCHTRACCNVVHMELVTNKENILRGESPAAQNARKTHCIKGHEFNE